MALAGAAALLPAACAWTPVRPYEGTMPPTETAYVAALGWHTEIGLGTFAITGPLASLERGFPDAHYLMFGWGERDYYMAAEPGSGDLLRALFPGPAVMLVRALDRPPQEIFGAGHVYAVAISARGAARLSAYLWGYLDKDAQDRPRRLGNGFSPASAFYAAAGKYDVGSTCNTWTAEALHVAGLPVNAAGVVFAGQVIDRVRPLAR
jgi:uncharacterized protein (TIGR02117 family)